MATHPKLELSPFLVCRRVPKIQQDDALAHLTAEQKWETVVIEQAKAKGGGNRRGSTGGIGEAMASQAKLPKPAKHFFFAGMRFSRGWGGGGVSLIRYGIYTPYRILMYLVLCIYGPGCTCVLIFWVDDWCVYPLREFVAIHTTLYI